MIAKIKVNDKKVDSILCRLDKARKEIYKCYSELNDLQHIELSDEKAIQEEQPKD